MSDNKGIVERFVKTKLNKSGVFRGFWNTTGRRNNTGERRSKDNCRRSTSVGSRSLGMYNLSAGRLSNDVIREPVRGGARQNSRGGGRRGNFR